MRKNVFTNSIKFIVMITLVTLTLVSATVGARLGFSGTTIKVRADDPRMSYTIRSAQQFNEYAAAYNNGDKNPKDTLVFSINSGDVLSGDGYISLGTSARPFAGTIEIPSSGIDTFHLWNCPLFDHVSTDLTISGAGVVKIIREKANETPAAGVLTSGALFANHVHAGASPAEWNINLLPYDGDEGNGALNFAGLIGDIAEDAEVNVTFKNDTDLNVSGTGNVGLICGTLNARATLGVTTVDGAASSTAVSTTGGHAGGLVGEMRAGATLRFDSANNSDVTGVTTTSDGKYAGGIVGYLDDGIVAFKSGVTDYTVKGTVAGKEGAGGLFGYYKANENAETTVTLADYTITSGMSISATNYAGGVFGVLDNLSSTFTFNGNAETTTVGLSGGSIRGGVIGQYRTDALANTLTVTNVINNVTAGGTSGGLIGGISQSPAYVLIDGETGAITTAGNAYGGLVGTEGGGNSFIDVKGAITVTGGHSAGIVGTMTRGVLRLKGTTDLSGASFGETAGVIVKERDRSLIYALGSGSDYNDGTKKGWSIKRRSDLNVDDVYTWGQVLRVDGSTLTEGGLFTVNNTNHTVSVKAPAAKSIPNVTQFTLTALNIQLNTAASGDGALRFAKTYSDGTWGNAALLSSALTITANINLSGTGIEGFTRDDGANGVFTGSLSGAYTITLATGEAFGVANYQGYGNVHNHKYVGLFAKAGKNDVSGVQISGVTVAGTMRIRPLGDNGARYVGGLVAYVQDKVTFTNVTASPSITVKCNQNTYAYVGGAVGDVHINGKVDVFGGTFGALVTDETSDEANENGGDVVFGGVIGNMEGGNDASKQAVLIESGAVLSATYSKSYAVRTPFFGAAIGRIMPAKYQKDSRTVGINNVTVNFTASATPKERKTGALIGAEWFAVDATMTALHIGASASVTATGAADMGGLFSAATGHFDIVSLNVASGASISAASGSTFGFVANKGYTADAGGSALYLDIDGTGSNYDIANLGLTGSFTTFDEVLADSRFSEKAITDNGQAIVSIKTTGGTIGSAQITYLNKTAYGTADDPVNADTRYYYNLKQIRENGSASNAEKFLIWSVKVYAHSSLAGWFDKSAFTGDLDMTGLSYYPVKLSGDNVTFENAQVTLDNALMESRVNYVRSSTAGRSTRSDDNQHYLMHTALFIDVTSTISINGGLKISGNVPKLSDNFCGFLVAGTLGGPSGGQVTHDDEASSNVVFDGAHILQDSDDNGVYDKISGDIYAPLFVNKVAQNATIKIKGARQSTDKTENGGTQSKYGALVEAGFYAASSLIGAVGGTDKKNINLTLSELSFDARTTGENASNMNDCYGTKRSVFCRATLLESFIHDGNSDGTYNFNITDDYSGGAFVHNVTYGKEITSSIEYRDLEKMYADTQGATQYYTHPTTYLSTSAYDFSTGYLPYVHTKWNNESSPTAMASSKHHELMVNINVTVAIAGCGKYADPYIIESGDDLNYIANVISGATGKISETSGLTLPASLTDFDCPKTLSSPDTDKVYKYVSGAGNFQSGSDTYTLAEVRAYLAGAYYGIEEDIQLPASFVGLGYVTDDFSSTYSCQYAFRGVIVGYGGEKQITNYSSKPLVYSANGCVIKDVVVAVNATIVVEDLTVDAASTVFKYSSGQQTYGAVIGQVMGGDNIIDGVSVNYDSATVTWEDASSTRVVPVGGYAGVLLNGGLIFRGTIGAGLSDAKTGNKISDMGWLYVNPVIGRVIAGYAFYEATAYHYLESDCTVKNGVKNYSVPDLDKTVADASKLNVTYTSSKFYVSVPNGQALFVLASIINSGAASAQYNDGSEKAYTDVNSGSATANAYRAHTTARALSDYSGIGTTGGGYTAAKSDKYSSDAIKVPYVIRKYAYNTGARFMARCLGYYQLDTVTITGNSHTPESFRGIGNMYDNSQYIRLGFTTFTGKPSSTIYKVEFNTKYYEYNFKRGIAYKYKSDEDNTGYQNFNNEMSIRSIGLFNQVYDFNMTIRDLDLAGSITSDLRDKDTGGVIEYNFGYEGTDPNDDPLSGGVGKFDGVSVNVGGLCGFVYNKTLTVNNVHFSGDFSARGAKWAGGLVGAMRGATLNLVNCGTSAAASSVSVFAGHQAGGFVAWNRACTININQSTGSSQLTIGEISVFGNTDANLYTGTGNNKSNYNAPDNNGRNDSNNNGAYCVGGCISYTRDLKASTIKNVTITGQTVGFRSSAEAEWGDNLNHNDAIAFAGGFIGAIHRNAATVTITGCNLNGVSVYGEVAGGILGAGGDTSTFNAVSITNCTLDGDQKSATITGTNKVGGIVGYIINKSANLTISSAKVKDYNIVQLHDHNDSGAGGLIGHLLFNGTPDRIDFHDITVSGCGIRSGYTTNNNQRGTGGLIGLITSAAGVVNGYDIFVNDTVVKNGNDYQYGVFVGSNRGNAVFKIAGLSFDNVTTNGTAAILGGSSGDTLVTGQLLVNASSYAIFADYKATTVNQAFYTVGSGYTNVAANEPYVTANPTASFGGITLTGDGVALTVNDLTIQRILYDIANGDKYKYAYSATYNYDGSAAPTTYALFNDSFKSQIKMFKTEVPEYTGTDFPVYIIESNDSATVTKMINSYLRLLTNTRLSFESGSARTSANFDVVLYKMSYSGSAFVYSTTGVSLQYNNDVPGSEYFYTTNRSFDSGAASPQFTLIDVRFKNPKDTTKIAYHLYVPVFVKRVLNYRFDVAVESGTTYTEGAYSPYYGDPAIENVGSPITVYFKYTYQRNAEDWLSAVSGGENVRRNFGKSLLFYKANDNAILKDFPDDTVFVLVDPNNGGKAYYSKKSAAIAGNVLSLTAFKTVMGKDGGGHPTFSGDDFAPANLDTWLDFITAVEHAEGPMVRCLEGAATVKIGEYYYRAYESSTDSALQRYSLFIVPDTVSADAEGAYVTADASTGTVKSGNDYFRLATDGDEALTHYAVTLNGEDIDDYRLEERYYLSVFTDSSAEYDKFHYYLITSPSSLADASYPSKISDTDAHTMVHLVMGKIFDHGSFTIVSSSENGTYVMSASNNQLSVTMSARMGLSRSLDEDIMRDMKSFVSAVNVYHSFMLYLNRKEDSAVTKAIIGSPDTSGEYATYRLLSAEEIAGGGIAAGDRYSASAVLSPVGLYTDRNSSVTGALTSSDPYVWFDGTRYYRALTGEELSSGDIDAAYRYNVSAAQSNAGLYVKTGGAYPTVHGNQNYVEFVSDNLAASFATGDMFNVSATVGLEYSSGAVAAQFPGRSTLQPDNGVSVSGASNIGFSVDKTAYSKNTQRGDETPAVWYYSEADPESAVLYLNPMGDKYGDFSGLGVNALNVEGSEATFDLLAELDVTSVIGEVKGFTEAVVTVSLFVKTSDGDGTSYDESPLDIGNYINEVSFADAGSATLDGNTYVKTLDRDKVVFNGAEVTIPLMRFTVKTGAAFEAQGLLYANYKIVVTVGLRGKTATPDNEGLYVYDNSAEEVYTVGGDGHLYRAYNSGTDGGMQRFDLSGGVAVESAEGDFVLDASAESVYTVGGDGRLYRAYNVGTDGGMQRYSLSAESDLTSSFDDEYVIYTNARIIPDFIIRGD